MLSSLASNMLMEGWISWTNERTVGCSEDAHSVMSTLSVFFFISNEIYIATFLEYALFDKYLLIISPSS
jgi:hypothetical protein